MTLLTKNRTVLFSPARAGFGYASRMVKEALKKQPTRRKRAKKARTEPSHSMVILSVNLQALMQSSKTLNSQGKLAARAKVGQRTVGRALKMTHAIQIDSLDAIAGALGYSAWQLLDSALTIKPTVEEYNRRMRFLLDQQIEQDSK